MKMRFLTVLVCLLSMFFLSLCKKTEEKKTDQEIPPSHPRILLLEGEEEAISQTIKSDNSLRSISTFILSESDKIIPMSPVERVLIGQRLLDKSRTALMRIFYLSYSYRLTSDTKYLNRAEKEMLAVSAFSDWHPSHFLDVAEMTMGVAIGYDWLYNVLSQESRDIIKKAIVEKGLKPSLNSTHNYWLKNNNNWNQVCNAGITFGALAVYEDEKDLADQLIDRALSSMKIPLAEYDPDGAYPEGYGYWDYGTSFHVMLVSALRKAFGDILVLPLSEGFFKTASYRENLTGPTGIPFNYSDCGTSSYLNPTMFWFADELGDPSILWSEKYLLLNKPIQGNRLLPAMLVWCSSLPLYEITAPTKRIWLGQGDNPVALMRTSWTDKNAIFVGLKAGSPSVSHAHMDVGTFVMDATGERWAMDFGTEDYTKLESAGVNLWNMSQSSTRWNVFRYNNLAHTTLTINNKYQIVRGKASITQYSSQQHMMNAVTDISGVYSEQLRKAVRGIAIIDGQYVMVRDEVETLSSSTLVRWNMVTSATATIKDERTIELVKNNKKLILKVAEPASVTMKTWSTTSPNSYDAPNPGTTMVGFETTIPENSSVSLTVLLLPAGAAENSVMTSKKISEWPVTSIN